MKLKNLLYGVILSLFPIVALAQSSVLGTGSVSVVGGTSGVAIKDVDLSTVTISQPLLTTTSISTLEVNKVYTVSEWLQFSSVSTDGTIDSYEPDIPEMLSDGVAFKDSVDGPFAGFAYTDLAGKIENLCEGASITLYAYEDQAELQSKTSSYTTTDNVKLKWYRCVAKKFDVEAYLKEQESSKETSSRITFPSLDDYKNILKRAFFPPYQWGAWEETGDDTRSINVSRYDEFKDEDIMHIAYCCVITYPAGYNAVKREVVFKDVRTGIAGISRADRPTYGAFSIEDSYVCDHDNAVVQIEFEVIGDGAVVYWEKSTDGGAWEHFSDNYEYLEFDASEYNDGDVDYRLHAEHSCLTQDYNSPSLRDSNIYVDIAGRESLTALTPLEQDICLGSTASFSLSMQEKAYSASYATQWQVSKDSGATWSAIYDGSVYSGASAMLLQVNPNDERYNGYHYRCRVVGPCKTFFSSSFVLTMNVAPSVPVVTFTPSKICPGKTVTLSASDTSSALAAPLQYRWRVNDNYIYGNAWTDDSGFEYTVGLSDVSISCEVQNSGACSGTYTSSTVQVPVYSLPSARIADPQSTACGGAEVTLTASTDGGRPVYKYEWSVPANATDLLLGGKVLGRKPIHIDNIRTSLPAEARYYVTVTDACGNTDTTSVYVDGPKPLSLSVDVSAVRCKGEKNGAIELIGGGGTSDYVVDVIFDPQQNNHRVLHDTLTAIDLKIDTLIVGEYLVKVTDACDSVISETVYVSEPDEFIAVIGGYKNITCNNGGDGWASVNVGGGTKPYNINWMNGQKTEKAVGLFAGLQSVTVTDNKGCFSNAQIMLTEPVVFNGSYLSEDASCNGASDGRISLIAKNGTMPYEFQLLNAKNELEGTAEVTENLQAGIYTYSMKDACGVELAGSITISQPEKLDVDFEYKDISCFGRGDGQANAVASNAVGGIVYEWSTGSSNASIANLDSGFYVVTVSDECFSYADSIYISEPAELNVAVSKTDINCYGVPSGTASATVTGGNSPYSYLWSNGMRTASIGNLFAGDYTVQIVDRNGCLAQNSASIVQSPLFAAALEVTPIVCAGADDGQIVVNTNANKGTLDFQWSDSTWNGLDTVKDVAPGTYSVTVTNSCLMEVALIAEVLELNAPLELSLEKTDISCFGENDGLAILEASGGTLNYTYEWNTGEQTRKIDSLVAGKYYYTVNDACATITDSLEIVEPEPLQIAVSGTGIDCFGQASGTATVVAEGGVEPYIYLWNNGQRSPAIGNLFAGEYTVQVADANGCAAFNSVELLQNARFSASIEKYDIVCGGTNSGSIIVNTSLVSGTAAFDWSNDAWDGLDTVRAVAPGVYTVQVSDACGATLTLDAEIEELNLPMSVQHRKQDISCHGQTDGEISLAVENGVKPYSVAWSNGMEGMLLTGLAADTLVYSVKDQCGLEVKDTLVVEEPELFDVALDVTDASCFGAGNGSASVQLSGGVGPFIYNWSIGVQAKVLNGLFPGQYSINVFDANGCLASESFEITQPDQIDVSASVVPAECGMQNGEIHLSVSGGNEPYAYSWNTGAEAAELSGLPADEYALTVTDANACEFAVTIPVEVAPPVMDICMLTVDKEIGKNKVVWEEFKNTSVTAVNIYRMLGGEFQWMGRVDSSKLSFFDDRLSNPKAVPSRYVITAEDACGNESDFSPFHQTIHLGAAKGTDGQTSVLDWTEYIDESGDFSPQWYYLYRGSSEANLQLFDSVDAKVATEYNDVDPQAAIYYKISVKKEGGCDPRRLKTDSGPFSHSISNIAEVELGVTAVEDAGIVSTVSPNPSKGVFVIQSEPFGGCRAIVSDIAGKEIWASQLEGPATKVDLSGQSMGIYTLQIICGDDEKVIKLIIDK